MSEVEYWAAHGHFGKPREMASRLVAAMLQAHDPDKIEKLAYGLTLVAKKQSAPPKRDELVSQLVDRVSEKNNFFLGPTMHGSQV